MKLDIDAMSPEQKVEHINGLRNRQLKGDKLSHEELAVAVRLLRDVRAGAALPKGKGKAAPVTPMSLSEF